MSWSEQTLGGDRDNGSSAPLKGKRRRRSTPGGAGERSERPPKFEKFNPEEPCELTPELVEKHIEHSRTICFQLLSTRPRTRVELAKALAKKGIVPEAAEAVLERFNEVGLIDDALFAKAWVTSRHHGRGLARRALGMELRRKGVDSELIGAALDELDSDTEEETARALVARRMRSMRGPSESVIRRLVGMLARKGYAPGLAYKVVKEAMEEAALDTELLDAEAFEDHDVES